MGKRAVRAAAERMDDHGKGQARAQYASIAEMVAALEAAGDDAREEAETRIHEDPLSVRVRSDWREPGEESSEAVEFEILLCTGGPAVRIIGSLAHEEPDTARLEYQDWGTPWTEYGLSSDETDVLLTYCRQFYFGG